MATFIERIKNLRSEAQLSLRQLSKITSISPSAIHSYEIGAREPSYKSLSSLSKAFNCSIKYLLGESDIKGEPAKSGGMIFGSRTDDAIARNIHSYRKDAGLSAKEFAHRLDIDEETVLNIERGEYKIDKEMTFKICDVLHITPDFLSGIIFDRLEEDDIDAEYCYERFTSSVKCNLDPLPPHETKVMTAYRSQPEMQPAVDKLLGVTEDGVITLSQAAKSAEHRKPGYEQKPVEKWTAIENAPETDDDLL